jgi:hypothetical protein
MPVPGLPATEVSAQTVAVVMPKSTPGETVAVHVAMAEMSEMVEVMHVGVVHAVAKFGRAHAMHSTEAADAMGHRIDLRQCDAEQER